MPDRDENLGKLLAVAPPIEPDPAFLARVERELGRLTTELYGPVPAATPRRLPDGATHWKLAAGLLLLGLVGGSLLWLGSSNERRQMPMANSAARQNRGPATLSKQQLPSPVTFDRQERGYHRARQLLEQQQLSEAIGLLQREVIDTGGGWRHLADAHNLIARAHFYRVHLDMFDELSRPERLGHLEAAMAHFRRAQFLYGQAGQRTRFLLRVHPWMPESRLPALFAGGRARRRVSYGTDHPAACERAARWMKVWQGLCQERIDEGR